MEIFFNLHRFGVDECAVGQLINGDLPEDDEERWRILGAPRYRIQKLLDAHLRARAALHSCGDSGRPFVLFLRSFSTEHKTYREGRAVATSVATDSYKFQEWLQTRLAGGGVPLIKLHGGSDAVMPEVGGAGNELSTHSENWEAVAAELIRAAAAIVVLISDLSPGVMTELELIRDSGRTRRCLVAVSKLAAASSGVTAGDVGRTRLVGSGCLRRA
jgi:hypothetical protein